MFSWGFLKFVQVLVLEEEHLGSCGREPRPSPSKQNKQQQQKKESPYGYESEFHILFNSPLQERFQRTMMEQEPVPSAVRPRPRSGAWLIPLSAP